MSQPSVSADVLESAGDDLRQATAIALGYILENDEAVQWSDISGQMAKSHWDRLVQTELLVDVESGSGSESKSGSGSGYRFADQQAVRRTLSDSPSLTEIFEPSTKWSFFDKLSASLAIVMLATRSQPEVRSLIGSTVDPVLSLLLNSSSFWLTLGVLGVMTSLWSAIVVYFQPLPESAHGHSIIEALSFSGILHRFQELREAEDEETLERIDREQREELIQELSDTTSVLKLNFRSYGWTAIVGLVFLQWISWTMHTGLSSQNTTVLLPIFGRQPWAGSLFGIVPVWFVWYVLCTVLTSIIVSKLKTTY